MSSKKLLVCHLCVVIFATAVLLLRSSTWTDGRLATQLYPYKPPVHHDKEQLMSSQYQYEPLTSERSIRVFTLYPSRYRDAPIRGQLSQVDLDSRPSYEALSYLCGQKEPGFEVNIVASQSGPSNEDSTVPVTPNCVAALRILRDCVKPRTLWVDAICIDQAPSPEKSQQVALMTEIFETAETVLMWLDPGDETATQVSYVARFFRLVGWLYRLRLLRLYERDEQTNSRMPPESRAVIFWDRFIASGSAWLGDSFNAVFLNRYFHRVWTVQEIAMARKILIHYGTEKIQWRDFVASGLFAVKRGGFARNQEASTEVFRDSERHWNLINSLESHFVLPDIYGVEALYDNSDKRNMLNRYTPGTAELALFKSKGLEATEPKDKAYAMLWAFPDPSEATTQLRRVDYDKPLELIYTEFTTATFIKTNGSTVQMYLVNSQPRLGSLPSWVPDWSQTNSMSYFVWVSRLRDFRAAGEDSLRYRIGIEGPLLRISGVEYCGMRALVRFSVESRQRDLYLPEAGDLVEALIDTAFLVKGLIDTARQLAGVGHEESILEAFHRVVHSQKSVYSPGPEDQLEFFARPKEKTLSEGLEISVGLLRLLVFDRLSFLVEANTIPKTLVEVSLSAFLLSDEVETITRGAAEHPNLTPFLAVVVALSPYIDLYHFLHIILLDHRDKDMFITNKGHIGMAFQGLQKDDLIVLWQGCPSPMVVRKVPDAGEDRYQLHGPAYVDGVMMGEAWATGDSQLRKFEVV